MMRTTMKIADVKNWTDEQFNHWLEGIVNANLHVPVLEGSRSGSDALDQGRPENCVPEAGVLGTCAPDNCNGTCVQTNEREGLHSTDDANAASTGIHDGSAEETSTLDVIIALFKMRTVILRGIAESKALVVEGEKLLQENSRLGAEALMKYLEIEDAE